MLFIILLFLCGSAQAKEILYNMKGEQRVEGFGPNGTTFGEVVWDSDRDGPLPADAPIGYAERYEVEEERVREKRVDMLDEDGKPKLDERGRPMFETILEKYTVMVPKLRPSQTLLLAKQAREKVKAEKDLEAEKEKSDFLALRAKIESENATAAEVRKAFKLLLKQLGK